MTDDFTSRPMSQVTRGTFYFLIVYSTALLAWKAEGATVKAPCTEDTWKEFQEEHGFGASRGSSTTLRTCQAECVANPSCLAIDFNKLAFSCWIFTDPATLEFRLNIEGIDHFVLQRCDATTVTTASTTAATTTAQQTTTTTRQTTTAQTTAQPSTSAASTSRSTTSSGMATSASTCTDDIWEVLENMHSFYGATTTDTDVAACRASCLANPACLAIDFDAVAIPPQTRCYIFTDPFILQYVLPATGVQHHKLTRCPTKTSTGPTSGSTTGTSQGTSTMTQGTGTTAMGSQGSSSATSGVCGTWMILPGRHSSGGTEVAQSTLEGCRKFCEDLPTCVAVDFNEIENPNSCWYYTDKSKLAIYAMRPGINQWRFERCESTTGGSMASTISMESGTSPAGTTSFSASTPGGTSATSSAATSGTSVESSATTPARTCDPVWTLHVNRHSSGGTMQAGITDLTACRDYCVRNQPCAGIDFNRIDSPPTCWTYADASQLLVKAQRENIDQYVLVECAPPPPPSGATTTTAGSPVSTSVNTGTTGSTAGGSSEMTSVNTETTGSTAGGSTEMTSVNTGTTGGSSESTSGMTTSGGTTPCVPTPGFQEFVNKTSRGGTPQPSQNTVDTCKAFCVATPSCKAVGFEKTASSCMAYFEDVTQQFGSETITLYIIDRLASCRVTTAVSDVSSASTSSASSAATSTSTAAPSTTAASSSTNAAATTALSSSVATQSSASSVTTASLSTEGTSQAGCTLEFKPNLHSPGASQLNNITNTDDCKNFCLRSPLCFAIDINNVESPIQCWYYASPNNLDITAPIDGVDQYVKRC